MRIYIAGPISGPVSRWASRSEHMPMASNIIELTVREKVERFAEAADILKEQLGLRDEEVVSPIDVGNDKCVEAVGKPPNHRRACLKPGEVPNGQGEHSWACNMRHDLESLLDCSHIALLPYHERSRGARLERHVAQELGLETLYFSHDWKNNRLELQ